MKNRTLTIGLVVLLLALARSTRSASESDIYQTIRAGERAGVEKLLQEGVSPNARDASGNTLLMRAAWYGNPELLSFLISKGAEVNATNSAGSTALMRAAGDVAKIKILLENGANVNAK